MGLWSISKEGSDERDSLPLGLRCWKFNGENGDLEDFWYNVLPVPGKTTRKKTDTRVGSRGNQPRILESPGIRSKIGQRVRLDLKKTPKRPTTNGSSQES